VPDIDTTVAIEVDAVLVIFGWQKLREPRRAGPGGSHVLAADGALAENLKGQNELVAIGVLATADIGLGRQHANGVIGQLVAAVVCLATPDREHDGGGHAETAFDVVQ
jgi:hypothetical protein